MQIVISWEVVSTAVTILIAMFGLLFGAIKWLLGRYIGAIEMQVGVMVKQIADQAGDITRLDKEILKLRGEIARDYYTREDHIRYETLFHAKMDAVGAKVENLILRSANAAANKY
jgi:hypothetical protein